MSQARSSSRSPPRRSNSPEKDPKILQAQQNAKKGMAKRKKKSFWDKYAYHIVIGGFVVLCATALFSTFFSKSRKIHLTPIVDQEDIDVHNADNFGFKLGHNDFFEVTHIKNDSE
jgi:cathepsin B